MVMVMRERENHSHHSMDAFISTKTNAFRLTVDSMPFGVKLVCMVLALPQFAMIFNDGGTDEFFRTNNR